MHLLVAAGKIVVPHKGIRSFLGDNRKLEWDRGRLQIASTRLCSLRSIPWADSCQTSCLPFRPKLLDKQIGLFLKKDWMCVSVCYLYRALGVLACQELPLQLLKSHGTWEHKPPWPPEPGNPRVSPGWQPQNLGHQTWLKFPSRRYLLSGVLHWKSEAVAPDASLEWGRWEKGSWMSPAFTNKVHLDCIFEKNKTFFWHFASCWLTTLVLSRSLVVLSPYLRTSMLPTSGRYPGLWYFELTVSHSWARWLV